MAERRLVLLMFFLGNGFDNGEATAKLRAISLSPWYCHRLVPVFITSAVTPCTYPCLLLSAHEHPHIVVRPESDGTPCRITTGRNHGFKMGTCGGSVCRNTSSHHNKLKRKKRFICLYSIVKLIQENKKLKALSEEMSRLQNGVALRRFGLANAFSGRGVETRGTGRSGTIGSGSANTLRIFIHRGGTNVGPRNTANSGFLEESGGRSVGNSGGNNRHGIAVEGSGGAGNERALSYGDNSGSTLLGGSRSRRGGSGTGATGHLGRNGPPSVGNRMRVGGPASGRGLTIGRAGLGRTGFGSALSTDGFSSGLGTGGRNTGAPSLGMNRNPTTYMSMLERSGVSNALGGTSADNRFSGNLNRAAEGFSGSELSNVVTALQPVSNAAGGTSSLGSGGSRVNDATRAASSGSGGIESGGLSVPPGSLFEVDNV